MTAEAFPRERLVHLAQRSSAYKKVVKAMTKFVVKVNRGGIRSPEYVERIDRTSIRMTLNRKLALVMGRFTAEDIVKSIQTSRCSPELVCVQVSA
jgi:hypothetical protein